MLDFLSLLVSGGDDSLSSFDALIAILVELIKAVLGLFS